MESTATSTVRHSSASPAMASKSKLRYPLRSALKAKEEKKDNEIPSTSPFIKRGRNNPFTITKSMSALHVSDRKLPSRTPRRLSVPMNSKTSQPHASTDSMTPESENRAEANVRRKSQKPASETTKFTRRRKFSTLSSVSYWLSQIKLSETASKHSISLGFFKLALESECELEFSITTSNYVHIELFGVSELPFIKKLKDEPLQRIREELKSYAVKHNIVAEFGEPARELFKIYDILEDLECLQDKEQPSAEKKNTSISVGRTGRLKPRSLNSETSKVSEANKIEGVSKFHPTVKTRASCKRNMTKLGAKDGMNSITKNFKTKKLGSKQGVGSGEKATKKSPVEKEKTDSDDIVNPSVAEHIPEENKENMDNQSEEETRPNEEPQTK